MGKGLPRWLDQNLLKREEEGGREEGREEGELGVGRVRRR